MIKLLAFFVTAVAASMTAVAAWDRGGTLVDKVLLVAMSVVIVLAVHLLLAMSRRPASWLVWAGCLMCAIYGHITFLTHASIRAGDSRAQQSSLVVGTERQIVLVREALAEIKARPVTTVAAELAQSDDRRARAALREEITAGRRAETLRDELAKLSGASTAAQVSGAADPVTANIAAVTGWSESAIAVVIGLTFSILLELIGALLWVEALRYRSAAVAEAKAPDAVASCAVAEYISNDVIAAAPEPANAYAVPDPVAVLRAAIASGTCRKTVASIRAYLGCTQDRAIELQNELVSE